MTFLAPLHQRTVFLVISRENIVTCFVAYVNNLHTVSPLCFAVVGDWNGCRPVFNSFFFAILSDWNGCRPVLDSFIFTIISDWNGCRLILASFFFAIIGDRWVEIVKVYSFHIPNNCGLEWVQALNRLILFRNSEQLEGNKVKNRVQISRPPVSINNHYF